MYDHIATTERGLNYFFDLVDCYHYTLEACTERSHLQACTQTKSCTDMHHVQILLLMYAIHKNNYQIPVKLGWHVLRCCDGFLTCAAQLSTGHGLLILLGPTGQSMSWGHTRQWRSWDHSHTGNCMSRCGTKNHTVVSWCARHYRS